MSTIRIFQALALAAVFAGCGTYHAVREARSAQKAYADRGIGAERSPPKASSPSALARSTGGKKQSSSLSWKIMAQKYGISLSLRRQINIMPRYFIHLAYNGSRYHGYQIQPHSESVQQTLEQCLSLKLGQTISITGCGRTDTGVHARNYYAHFDIEQELNDTETLAHQMNAFLPEDIVIYRIWQVAPELHARFDAVSRTYHYYITRTKNPFHTQDAYFLYGDLDVAKMQEAANILFEYVDFTSFSKVHTQVKTNNCKIMEARWFEQDGLLVLRIKADRFLRNMVRAIVGTLLEIGKGRMTIEEFRAVIERKDRCEAGTSVPAHALFLEEVEYKS